MLKQITDPEFFGYAERSCCNGCTVPGICAQKYCTWIWVVVIFVLEQKTYPVRHSSFPDFILRCQNFASSVWVWRFRLALKNYNICEIVIFLQQELKSVFTLACNFKPMQLSSVIGLTDSWWLVLSIQFWNTLHLIKAFEFQIVWNSFRLQCNTSCLTCFLYKCLGF